MGMVPLKKAIAQTANAYVHSVELCSEPSKLENCDGEDQKNGFLMTMDESLNCRDAFRSKSFVIYFEVDQFARVVKADPKLQSGFNAVGFSQGNTVIRGYIHKYNNPPVKTFLSMHGVLMGVNGLPQCPMSVPGLGAICRTVDALVSHFGVYSSLVQNRLAQANYYRDAENLAEYRSHGHFLPYINNEVQGQQNATYKKNFEANMARVTGEDDTMVHPKESEHFGYFKDGSRTELVDMRDAPWYTEDWKKIDFHSTPGNHLRFKKEFLLEMVKQYFVSESSMVDAVSFLDEEEAAGEPSPQTEASAADPEPAEGWSAPAQVEEAWQDWTAAPPQEAPEAPPWGEAEAVEAVAEDAETAETGGRCGDGRDAMTDSSPQVQPMTTPPQLGSRVISLGESEDGERVMSPVFVEPVQMHCTGDKVVKATAKSTRRLTKIAGLALFVIIFLFSFLGASASRG
eukprot:g12427.t1